MAVLLHYIIQIEFFVRAASIVANGHIFDMHSLKLFKEDMAFEYCSADS